MQKQEFEERIERTVTDEQYKVIEEVYMWHPSLRNTSGKADIAFREMESEMLKVIKQDEKSAAQLKEILAKAKERMMEDD